MVSNEAGLLTWGCGYFGITVNASDLTRRSNLNSRAWQCGPDKTKVSFKQLSLEGSNKENKLMISIQSGRTFQRCAGSRDEQIAITYVRMYSSRCWGWRLVKAARV